MTDNEIEKVINSIGDPYTLLGLEGGCTSREIKKAYRKKALIFHPDKNPFDPNSEERFLSLQLAYEFLNDKIRRKRYDAILDEKKKRVTYIKQQSDHKQKLAEQLAAREKKYESKTYFHETEIKTSHNELRRIQIETELWIKKKQQSLSNPCDDRKIDILKNFAQLPEAFLEVKWLESSPLLSTTKSSILQHIQAFGKVNTVEYSRNNRRALFLLSNRQEAIEAALHFLREKDKYDFTVKYRKSAGTALKKKTRNKVKENITKELSFYDFESHVMQRLQDCMKQLPTKTKAE